MLLHELEINNIVSNKIHPLLDTLIKNMNTNLSEDDMYKVYYVYIHFVVRCMEQKVYKKIT